MFDDRYNIKYKKKLFLTISLCLIFLYFNEKFLINSIRLEIFEVNKTIIKSYSIILTTVCIIILINTFIKFIPFYTIINTTVRIKDIIAGIILFIIYVMWVYVNGYSIIEYHNKIFESLVQDKNETPLMFLLEKIKVYFKKYTI